MKLLGYSERGFINALLYEIAYRNPEESQELVKKLFRQVEWPMATPPEGLFDACNTILVEQSFSDFGDADGLFLFTFGTDGGAVFLEGKRGEDYTLERAWKKFVGSYWSRARPSGLTSNLFCQVYFKQRLSAALRLQSGEDIEDGLNVEAPFDLADRKRKIGDNPVVLASVEMLRAHLGEVYYLLMVPEAWTEDLKAWWQREVATVSFAPMGWDVSRWGIVTIPEIVQFCHSNGLPRTLDVVRHNRGQLYVEPAAPGIPDLTTWFNRRGKRGVAVIYVPTINPNTSLHFFWVGEGCTLRDYSTATASKPPKPKRKETSEVLPLIEKDAPRSSRDLDYEKVAEWRAIIERQNAIWGIGNEGTAERH